MVIEPSPQGLHCATGGFHIDPWLPVNRAVITHAHGDHLRPGSAAYLCARASLPFVRPRLPEGAAVESLDFGETRSIDGVRLSFHPSGHIKGAAQVRVEQDGEVWVVPGDYKRQPDPTCEPFVPVKAHTFVTEATFALPVFRWQPTPAVIDEIVAWWDEMQSAGRPAVLFAYALGKAQRLLAELASRTDRAIYAHGAIETVVDAYQATGVVLPAVERATERRRGESFAGALILAPVSARGSLWMRRFANHSAGFASGWMRVRGARRRRGYDRGFALSDHADWDDLLQTVVDTGAERVFVTHGYTEPLARYLSGLGLDAQPWTTQFEGEAE